MDSSVRAMDSLTFQGAPVAGDETELLLGILDPYRVAIDAMLLSDLDAARKQRHTATPNLGAADRGARRGRLVVLLGTTRG